MQKLVETGEKLFTVDETGTVVGELAESATHNGDGSWTIALKAGHHFSDGSPVTAAVLLGCRAVDRWTRLPVPS